MRNMRIPEHALFKCPYILYPQTIFAILNKAAAPRTQYTPARYIKTPHYQTNPDIGLVRQGCPPPLLGVILSTAPLARAVVFAVASP